MISRSKLGRGSPSLLDHFVGAGEQRGRHGEAERLSRLEVDHQLELGRCSTGRSAGFSPSRNPIHVGGSLSIYVEESRP